MLRGASELPRTSQPSVGEFQDTFRSLSADGSELICLTISSDLSGTYLSARSAAESMPELPVHVVDSRWVSVGLALLAVRAVELAHAGRPAGEILDAVNRIISSMHSVFLVDTLEYLHKGGRIGTASAFLGTLLNIKPILTIKDGIVQPLHKIRSKAEAKRRMVEVLAEKVPAGSTVWAGVTHAQNLSDAQWMEEQLREQYRCERILTVEMGPVVGTHGGPGTIGAAVFPLSAGPQSLSV